MSAMTFSITTADLDTVLMARDVPVLVDFWAPWCGPCKAMLPTLEEVAELYAGELEIAKMNIEDDPGLVERFNARTIPLLILFRDGKETARMVGAMSKTRLCAFIDKYLETVA